MESFLCRRNCRATLVRMRWGIRSADGHLPTAGLAGTRTSWATASTTRAEHT
jgi:hypothetical protein